MDSQTPTASVPLSTADMQKRRTLLSFIIILAVVALGWFLYQNFANKVSNTVTDQHTAIVNQIGSDSGQVPQLPTAEKTKILTQVGTSAKTQMTPAEKASIIGSVGKTTNQ